MVALGESFDRPPVSDLGHLVVNPPQMALQSRPDVESPPTPGTPVPPAVDSRRLRGTIVGVAFAAVAVDIISKVWASSVLPGDPRAIGPVTLRLIHNHGGAFGVGDSLPAGVLIAASALVALTVGVLGWRGHLRSPIATGLIAGGAIANVADRLSAGSVVDFIDIGRWPVFNLADVMVLTGIGLLFVPQRGRSGEPHR